MPGGQSFAETQVPKLRKGRLSGQAETHLGALGLGSVKGASSGQPLAGTHVLSGACTSHGKEDDDKTEKKKGKCVNNASWKPTMKKPGRHAKHVPGFSHKDVSEVLQQSAQFPPQGSHTLVLKSTPTALRKVPDGQRAPHSFV